jgi:glycosyltransferase involved in cell wall biosynthesis
MLVGIDASRATIAQRTGTEAYSLHAIRQLVAVGAAHRFRLYFNTAPAADLIPMGENGELRVIPFPRLWTQLRLSAEMAMHAPDALWVPSHVLPLVHPRHSLVTVHDLGHRYWPGAHTARQRWYLEWSARYHARTAAHLFADSRATRDDLVRIYGIEPSRITVAYLGVDPALQRVEDAEQVKHVCRRYGISGPYLLYVGTLQPRKNLVRLLDAFSELRKLTPGPLQLVLAGRRGWLYQGILARVEELGLGQNVVLTGYVPDADLPALYSGATLFVLPSLYEGFAMPVLEAMACGAPVACSNVSSLPEVAGDAALLFDPRSVDGMVAAFRHALEDAELRATLSLLGKERAQQFTWERCARQVLRVLEQGACQ